MQVRCSCIPGCPCVGSDLNQPHEREEVFCRQLANRAKRYKWTLCFSLVDSLTQFFEILLSSVQKLTSASFCDMTSDVDVAPVDDLSENVYEQQRLARIAKNKEQLAHLGIVSAWQNCADQLPVNKKRKLQQQKQPRPAKCKAVGPAVESVRRSARLRREATALLSEEEDKQLAEESSVSRRQAPQK